MGRRSNADEGVTMEDDVKNLIDEAIAALKDGRAEDALLVLERARFPKFESRNAARDAYAGRASTVASA
jgi:hypothetical protein